jgi:ubiquinone/menaquinone biosynthesis C-methylase UbiE
LSKEVVEKYYGCGSPIPVGIAGATVVDLACGCGHDVFILSCLAGEKGRIIGVDLLEEHLAVARRNIQFHTDAFGYSAPNVEFHSGMIEDLSHISDNSVDVVTSNCAVNLSPEKGRVFSEILRVLKPGGQLLFSDVFADRRVPPRLRANSTLRGECLSGAMYWGDFRRLMLRLGVPDIRTMTAPRAITLSEELKALVGSIRFFSHTVSVFKLASLEDKCEEYGQAVKYLGTLSECPSAFELDDHHLFERGKYYEVCGNTAAMIQETRFSEHFEVVGNRNTHYGLFDCGSSPAGASGGSASDCC